jgi:hypothetical protein
LEEKKASQSSPPRAGNMPSGAISGTSRGSRSKLETTPIYVTMKK